MKRISQMTWLLGAALLLFIAAPGFADSVTFSTTGTFNGGACASSGSICSTGSGVSLSFEGLTNATVTPDQPGKGGTLFTFNSLGNFDASAGALTNFDGVSFTLNISQSDPAASPSSGDLLASLSGSLQTTSSGTEVIFSNPTSITLGGVTYQISSFTMDGPGVVLSPYTTNGGVTTLQGKISEAVTAPEPSAMLLLGSGLLSLAGLRKRLFSI